jgi:acyl-CoA thioesterase-1
MLWKTSAPIILLLNLLVMLSGEAAAEPTYIVAFGDSIVHGPGVSLTEAFPAQLENMLRADGFNVQVINAGVDGDTTPRMLMRMDSVIPQGTKIVIVHGGPNDFNSQQHGLSVEQSEANIEAIVSRLRAQQIQVVLCDSHTSRASLARKYGAALASCYDHSHLVDGLHLDVTGHRIIANRLLPVIEGLLRTNAVSESSPSREPAPPQRTDVLRLGPGPR